MLKMKARIEQIDRLNTTKGQRIMVILEITDGQQEVEKMKSNEVYSIELEKEGK